MKELTAQEMILIDGGSPESYAAGVAAGQKARKIADDWALAYTITSIACLVLFRVKI